LAYRKHHKVKKNSCKKQVYDTGSLKELKSYREDGASQEKKLGELIRLVGFCLMDEPRYEIDVGAK
jgi:hypothetical protein